jgi:hypothetical protein
MNKCVDVIDRVGILKLFRVGVDDRAQIVDENVDRGLKTKEN